MSQTQIQKPNPVQVLTAQVRQACLEMENDAKQALPAGSVLHTVYVSNSLARNGYSLARQYNTAVCNGITFILVVHPTEVEIFSAVCSVEDKYTRLDGRFETLKRLAQKYNSAGVVSADVEKLSIVLQKTDLVPAGVEATFENIVRGAVNTFIKDRINSKAKPKRKAFAPTREQVAQAEQLFLANLKKATNADYRLTYQYKEPKTGVRSQMFRKENVRNGTDVAFEETTVKLTTRGPEGEVPTLVTSATVVRYEGDANNRLAARWFALKKLAAQFKAKSVRK